MKGVTDALFLVIRNLGTSEYAIKNNAGVAPRGVVYTLRSVLRGSGILNAHFTGVYIPQRGCFSVCLLHRFPKTSNNEQADANTHVFLFVVSLKIKTRSYWVFTDNVQRVKQ